MAEKQNIPEIRFEGFTDPWEQRKLGELYSLVSEKNDLTFGRESIISVANMYFNANVNVTDEQYLRTYNVMRLGDIAFEGHSNKEFSHGRFVENYIGDGIVSHIFTVLRPRVPFDVNYWRYAINNEKLMRLSLIRSTKASTMMHDLVPSDFLREAIPTPTLAEQKEIGAFLVGLDHLITLHQRKYDKLCTVKKSMLDKMFPKPGETEPEIRFEGFTDPWEQRKLGEVAHRVIRKNEGNQSDLPLTISAQHGLVDQRDYFNNQVASRDMSGYYLLENGEFAYNKSTSGDSPWGAIKRLTKYEKGCLSTLYICFGLDLGDPDFLVTYYETNRWHGAVQMIAAEGARNHGLLNIAPDDFFETVLTLPCSTEEQKQIGCFFTQLNSLITLHQRKCQYRSLYGYLSWEQRKLGSIAASFDYGLNAAATEYDGQNKYLRITDIDDTTHEFLKSDLTTPLADLAMSADYLLEEGDLLFARTGASVGKTYLYRQYDGTVYFAGFLIRARIGESADPEFVYQATLTDAYKKYVAITSQRSGQPGVNAQEYADYQLMLPSRTEQQQIGMTLRSLDNLITLHQ